MSGVQAIIEQAVTLQKQGKLSEAAACYRQLLEANPNDANILQLLGSLHAQAREHEAAIECFKQSLILNPRQPVVFLNAGNCLLNLGYFEKAIKMFTNALALQPNWGHAHFLRGLAKMQLGRSEDALTDYRQALAFNYKTVEAYIGINHAMQNLRLYDEAIAINEEAIQTYPEHAGLKINYAIFLYNQGELDKAEAYLLEALALEPHNIEAYYNLSILRKNGCSDEHIKAMETLGDDETIHPTLKARLLFALAKSYADREQYKQSAAYYHQGNTLQKEALYAQYNVRGSEEYMKSLAIFSKKMNKAPVEYEDDGLPQPIFIVGMPRSGSTLVEQIISNHSHVTAGGELPYIVKQFSLGESDNIRDSVQQLFAKCDDEYLAQLAVAYRKKLSEIGDTPFIVDKMLYNFQYTSLLCRMFPKGKIIHTTRDARANCWSIYSMLFTGSNQYSYDMQTLARYYLAQERLMKKYKKMFPDRIYSVSYEELVSDPEERVRGLLDYCGLSFEDACLKFYESKSNVLTASATQVRQPIYKSSLEKWRHFESYIQPMLSLLEDKRQAA